MRQDETTRDRMTQIQTTVHDAQQNYGGQRWTPDMTQHFSMPDSRDTTDAMRHDPMTFPQLTHCAARLPCACFFILSGLR